MPRTAGLVTAAIAAAVMVISGASWVSGAEPTMAPDMDDGMAPSAAPSSMGAMEGPSVPPVQGYVDGTEVLFIHTEVSDEQIAETLTTMMGSPVIVVPSLAQVPTDMLANVYVFTNGAEPDGARGPLGFQPDVFDSAPGDPAYSPLRAIQLTTWKNPAEASILRSAEDVEAAIEAGLLSVAESGIVVNMPFLTWPGGSR